MGGSLSCGRDPGASDWYTALFMAWARCALPCQAAALRVATRMLSCRADTCCRSVWFSSCSSSACGPACRGSRQSCSHAQPTEWTPTLLNLLSHRKTPRSSQWSWKRMPLTLSRLTRWCCRACRLQGSRHWRYASSSQGTPCWLACWLQMQAAMRAVQQPAGHSTWPGRQHGKPWPPRAQRGAS